MESKEKMWLDGVVMLIIAIIYAMVVIAQDNLLDTIKVSVVAILFYLMFLDLDLIAIIYMDRKEKKAKGHG